MEGLGSWLALTGESGSELGVSDMAIQIWNPHRKEHLRKHTGAKIAQFCNETDL